MSSVSTSRPWFKPRSLLLTAADLADFPDELDNRPVKFELFDGELIVRPFPGVDHGMVKSRLSAALFEQAQQKGHGEAVGAIGIILRREPDRVVEADGAFILKSSLPAKVSPEDYLLTIPEIIVEVLDKNDSMAEVMSKIEEYHEAGTVQVWVVEPRFASVTIHRRDDLPALFRCGDTLTCDLLPGFAVPVRNLFDS